METTTSPSCRQQRRREERDRRKRLHSIWLKAQLAKRKRCPDPLKRFLDPEFDEVSWEYEHSHTDYRIPGAPHAKQLEVLHSTAKHRWLFWGNQCGKTTIGAIDVALLALGRHPTQQRWEPGLTIWASALTWELWETVLLPELLTWIPRSRVIDAPEPYAKSTKRTIRVRADNGRETRIEGKSAEQGAAKYQSRRLHAFWFDEEHPEAIWDEVQPRLLRHGGITLATMTPLKGLTWVYDRIYESWKMGTPESADHFCSHAGLVDNPSIPPSSIRAIKQELRNNPSMLAARLFGHFVRPQGLVLPFDPAKHYEYLDELALKVLVSRGKVYCGIDFGLWRFAFVAAVVDRIGRMHIVEEYFSQREDLDTRAKAIHDLLTRLGAPKGTPIWGDCANPTDVLELNRCFSRISSPYRVTGVAAENKIRKTAVQRVENLLNRQSLLVRRGIGEGQTWYLGQDASSFGKAVQGSRLTWELNNWLYPKNPTEGKLQKDDPDDATADGADLIAALRYLVMSWWSKAKFEIPLEGSAFTARVLARESEALRKGEAPQKRARRATRKRSSMFN
jgi:phage terminase large subunit-like protein